MTTDENIIACYEDLKLTASLRYDSLLPIENDLMVLNKTHMLSKFELWMKEDLIRLGLI